MFPGQSWSGEETLGEAQGKGQLGAGGQKDGAVEGEMGPRGANLGLSQDPVDLPLC